MWSTPEDRVIAAVRAEKLTPGQERARTERERCFNAGFDFAKKSVPRDVPIDFASTQYLEARRSAFERWDFQQRVDGRREHEESERARREALANF